MTRTLFDWLRRRDRDSSAERPLILIGLGNPGPKYGGTRHNVGFMCIDRIAAQAGIQLKDRRKAAAIGEGRVEDRLMVLAKPRTFVNRSGQAVRYLLDRYHADPTSLLIILDDMDLPLGKIRLRASGGSGGHNGLNSINDSVKTDAYSRLRVGIGRPESDTIEHVLNQFTDGEVNLLNEGLGLAVQAAETWLESGIDHAMNHFN